MIQASKAGYLFRTTDKIKADYPNLPAFTESENAYVFDAKTLKEDYGVKNDISVVPPPISTISDMPVVTFDEEIKGIKQA